MKKTAIIHLTCNASIGQGHLARCLNLADMLKNDFEIAFYGNIEDFGARLIENRGYSVTTNTKFVDLSIIDDYSVTSEQEKQIAQYSKKIMVIDDAPNRKHYCDILLDQNYTKEINEYTALMQKENTQFLLGPQYLLLGKEYHKTFERTTKTKPERCLIFFTGGDCKGATLTAIDAVKDLDFITDVVIGINNPYKAQIIEKVDKYPQMKLHIQTNKMRDLMANADFCIGSFGFNTWERLTMKLPTIGVILAENQKCVLRYIKDNNYAINLGHYNEINSKNIKHAIANIHTINFNNKLPKIQDVASKIIDSLS